MACTGTSSFPFSIASQKFISWSEEGRNHASNDRLANLSLLPAFSFGSMISVHNGNPFWRQRMVYKTISFVLMALQNESQSRNPPALGLLAVCATLCCLPVSLLCKSSLKQMVPILVAGLVHLSKDLSALTGIESSLSYQLDLLGLILAALIKLFALSPESVSIIYIHCIVIRYCKLSVFLLNFSSWRDLQVLSFLVLCCCVRAQNMMIHSFQSRF
jgi:hypothetical protein